MSSHTPPNPLEFDRSAAPLIAAVGAVAEQSFFAYVDASAVSGADADARSWLMAAVRFNDGELSGSVACWIPAALAQGLFDAFSGRDPMEPRAQAGQIEDLIGEFANMICGDWLTRCLGHRAFHLSPPLVVRAPRPAANPPRRQWLRVNDQPMAVDWDIVESAGKGHTA